MAVTSAAATLDSDSSQPFTAEQKEYLQGFMAGVAASGVFVGTSADGRLAADPRAVAPGAPNLAEPPEASSFHGTPVADLCKEERWKYEANPLDVWDQLVRHADEDKAPDGEHTYRFKFFGLFYVAPAQDSFMVRVRIPAGELTATQLHGLADLAQECGSGYADITTRAALQIRECRPRSIVKVLTQLQELGLTSRGSGADNVRNLTVTPTSGFDAAELLDVRPFAKGLHHYILNHRDLYGLPRKFNVAFDSGGSISAAADTNDIGFQAVRVTEKSLAVAEAGPSPGERPEPGVYFRVNLGGITGHGDFARDTGLLVRPGEAVAVAAAMIRVFAENGDRTNRKKSRLKYLLGKWGVEKFVDETRRKLAFPLRSLATAACEPRHPALKHGWIGTYRQAQRGLSYLGAGVPAGRMTARQMHRLADLAQNYGRGEVRLTVWQNFLIPHLPDGFLSTITRQVQRLGFATEASAATGGIVACTGNRGCKYAAADTKAHALATARHLAARDPGIEQPVNIHFTGCPHSCAQHYCGDLGYMGVKLADGSEGYHLVLGGGMEHEQGIARELFRGVAAAEVPELTARILRTYAGLRQPGETFVTWARRHSVKELQEIYSS
jgi:ferredoxin-nitrite reductase